MLGTLLHPMLTQGRVTFTRSGQVTAHGMMYLLGLAYIVDKRRKGQYSKAVLDTQKHRLTVDLNGRILKRWLYPYLKS